jgi:hypothetical protein
MAELVNVREVKYYKARGSPQTRDFKMLFRFEENSVQWLSNYFLGQVMESRGGALTSEQKMKVCLRYLANPGYQSGIGEELGVSQSTVSQTVSAVVGKIVEKADLWIKFPTTPDEIVQAKESWQSKYLFPTAIGVIDCTHIGVLKPRLHGDEYINRKNKPTLNVQGTCDSKEMFTSVDVSWPGSVHDARIWKNSQVREVMRTTRNTVLIGDDGYGLEPWLMTPFSDPGNESERKFNKLLKKERVTIERCFGQLKRRFPILLYVCRVKLENVPKIIVACVILHNIAKFLGDPDFELDEIPEEDEDVRYIADDGEARGRLRREGQAVRRNLAEIISQLI